MLTLINPSIVPNPGYFQVKHPTTGHVVTSANIRLIFHAYQEYCRLNDLEVLNNDAIIGLMCQQHPDQCKETTGPTLLERVVSVVKDTTKWIVNGLPITKGEAMENRLAICGHCEHFGGVAGQNLLQVSCRKCGCSGLKLGMETTVCPIGKW